jgi:hypothetical protein
MLVLSALAASARAQDGTWEARQPMPAVSTGAAPYGGLLNGTLFGFFGGNPNANPLGYGLAYNTLTDTWSALGAPPFTGSPSASDVPVVGSKLYFTGTSYDCANVSRAIWTFDGAAWAQEPTLAPVGLCSRAAASLDDKLYLIGGVDPWTGDSRVDIYDPATKQWSTAPSFPHVIEDATATAIDGVLYVAGGFNRAAYVGGDFKTGMLGELWRYDPATLNWVQLASMPVAVDYHRAVAFGGRLHLLGGQDRNRMLTALHQVYDPATNNWSMAGPMSVPRQGALLGTDSQFIYAAAGYRDGNWIVNTHTERCSEPAALVLDAGQDETLTSDLLGTARFMRTAVVTGGVAPFAYAWMAGSVALSTTTSVDVTLGIGCI